MHRSSKNRRGLPPSAETKPESPNYVAIFWNCCIFTGNVGSNGKTRVSFKKRRAGLRSAGNKLPSSKYVAFFPNRTISPTHVTFFQTSPRFPEISCTSVGPLSPVFPLCQKCCTFLQYVASSRTVLHYSALCRCFPKTPTFSCLFSYFAAAFSVLPENIVYDIFSGRTETVAESALYARGTPRQQQNRNRDKIVLGKRWHNAE